jgi:iron-sulfur cluster repair protein YtfE (RIC family)
MVVKIGAGRKPRDVVDMFLECHERIRSFSALAVKLSEARGVEDQELSDAAAQVTRYFAEALPLHAADEDESVLPRLRGQSPEVDLELEEMAREHRELEPRNTQLIELCTQLRDAPERLPELREELATVAKDVREALMIHIEREERVIFPAVRRYLDPETMTAIAQELRARRTTGPT